MVMQIRLADENCYFEAVKIALLRIYGSGTEIGLIKVATRDLIEFADLERYGVSIDVIEKNMEVSHMVHCEEFIMPGDSAIAVSEKALASSEIPPGEIDMVLHCALKEIARNRRLPTSSPMP